MSGQKTQFTIGFESLKDKPSYAVNGAWGGPTPDGSNVVAHVFLERYALPNYLTYDSEQDESGVRIDTNSEQRVARADVTREVQATLVMTPESALRLSKWLEEKAAEGARVRQRFIEENSDNGPEEDSEGPQPNPDQ